MAHTSTLVQSGEEFFVVTEDGGQSEITLPSTVVVSALRYPRFEVSGVHAVVVNSVDQPIIVDDMGIALFLSPLAPTAAPTVTAGTAGVLTGTYGVKYTFAIRTLDEVIVAESGFSPSASVVLTLDNLDVDDLQALTGLSAAIDPRYEIVRRIYRTVADGTAYFLWYTVEDNTTVTFEDDTTDAAISALAADDLATVPFLSLVANYRERLFGVNPDENREQLLYTPAGLRWAWPAENLFTAPQTKGDSQSGITALLPRHDALGITKSNMLFQLTGTDDTDFRLTTLSTSVGCVSNESAAIYRDQWYFLALDGVYRWGEDGLQSISDGRVRSWFTTDDYFNREAFTSAFGAIDIIDKSYKLYLQNLDDEIVWIEFDIDSGTWWGPHRTDAYTFTSAMQLSSHVALMGAGTDDGYISINTPTRSDNAVTAIEVEAITAPLQGSDPPTMCYFGTLSVEVEPQADGEVEIYPITGELADAEDTVLTHDMTEATIGLGRLGYGRFLTLRFFADTLGQITQILGFEVDPVNSVGRRQ